MYGSLKARSEIEKDDNEDRQMANDRNNRITVEGYEDGSGAVTVHTGGIGGRSVFIQQRDDVSNPWAGDMIVVPAHRVEEFIAAIRTAVQNGA